MNPNNEKKMSTPEIESNDKMTENELRVYLNHIKVYTDAVNDVFELNKTTAQINDSITLLFRKRLAIEQRLKTIKSIAGKRDLGQCEVSRLLLSEKLYHSTFNYVTLSTELDVSELNLDKNIDDDSPAVKKSIIDFYANRRQIQSFRSHRSNYTGEQLKLIEYDWLTKFKEMFNDNNTFDKIPDIDPSSLNEKQKLVFDIVSEYLNKKKQLLFIVNGTAGTGKSYTIYALSKLLKGSVKQCAPTAKAAFLINGETILPLFEITTDAKTCSLPLKSDKLLKFQNKFKGITHIIIDEYSMLSQNIFGLIDQRLREATGNKNELFGGISIILTEDPGQLNLVGGSPLYHNQPNNMLSTQVRQQNLENDPDQEYFLSFCLEFVMAFSMKIVFMTGSFCLKDK
ncbi:ATP-dependent DNA helicase PIF1 [Brachionus plicatilis]|uniref:ATP-dependent DNA helicase n=1 Tax=Brachionus plicatilis TaxID=10195 RepID=A0A3M7PBT0_BRAPC|nr:ATP-dependent DNA helicase PIF1 [Brachionus plicatilis]